MKQHALLSASSSSRWLACPPSARLCKQLPRGASSPYAAEGNDAHTLAEYKLRVALGHSAQDPTPNLTYYNAEMEEHAADYAAYIMELVAAAKSPLVLVEQRLDFSRYVPEGFGTGDCVIVADGIVHVIDFKYGQGVAVEAEDNPQMQLYALGALELFDGIYDIDAISMTVYQPRRGNVSTHTVSKGTLWEWLEKVLMPTAELAFEGKGEYNPGPHCQFCPAAVKCRARAESKLKLAAFEFAKPPLLADDDIEEILAKLDDLTTWANDIKEYALQAAISHGKQWAGFKLVEGRSNRKYTDEALVASAAIAAGYRDIYKQVLYTITEMEKLMGKAKLQKVLGHLIEKPPGKPTLVPITDKREPINVIEFKEEM